MTTKIHLEEKEETFRATILRDGVVSSACVFCCCQRRAAKRPSFDGSLCDCVENALKFGVGRLNDSEVYRLIEVLVEPKGSVIRFSQDDVEQSEEWLGGKPYDWAGTATNIRFENDYMTKIEKM